MTRTEKIGIIFIDTYSLYKKNDWFFFFFTIFSTQTYKDFKCVMNYDLYDTNLVYHKAIVINSY